MYTAAAAAAAAAAADDQDIPLLTLLQLRNAQSLLVNDRNQVQFSANLKLWIEVVRKQLPDHCPHEPNSIPAKCQLCCRVQEAIRDNSLLQARLGRPVAPPLLLATPPSRTEHYTTWKRSTRSYDDPCADAPASPSPPPPPPPTEQFMGWIINSGNLQADAFGITQGTDSDPSVEIGADHRNSGEASQTVITSEIALSSQQHHSASCLSCPPTTLHTVTVAPSVTDTTAYLDPLSGTHTPSYGCESSATDSHGAQAADHPCLLGGELLHKTLTTDSHDFEPHIQLIPPHSPTSCLEAGRAPFAPPAVTVLSSEAGECHSHHNMNNSLIDGDDIDDDDVDVTDEIILASLSESYTPPSVAVSFTATVGVVGRSSPDSLQVTSRPLPPQ